MKYTNYLINGNLVDPYFFEIKNKHLMFISRILSVQIAIMGIATVIGLLPISLVNDEIRVVRYKYICYHRNKRVVNVL